MRDVIERKVRVICSCRVEVSLSPSLMPSSATVNLQNADTWNAALRIHSHLQRRSNRPVSPASFVRAKRIYRCWTEVSKPIKVVAIYVQLSYLGEANVCGLLAEALTADVQAILADETGLVGADTAI